jgi:hypothetical protein
LTRIHLHQFIKDIPLSKEHEAPNIFDLEGFRKVVYAQMEENLDVTEFLGTALPVVLCSRIIIHRKH